MLSNEAREMMVKAYERTGNAKEVAECYGVDVSTVPSDCIGWFSAVGLR